MKKLLIGFTSIVGLYMLFFAGFDAAHHWYQNMGLSLILVAFFIGMFIVVMVDIVEDAKIEVRREFADGMKQKLDRMFAEVEKHLSEQMSSITPIVKKPRRKIPVKQEATQNTRVRRPRPTQTKLPLDKKK